MTDETIMEMQEKIARLEEDLADLRRRLADVVDELDTHLERSQEAEYRNSRRYAIEADRRRPWL